nr:MAG TPA: portal protein [Caudoviricetes sp.]
MNILDKLRKGIFGAERDEENVAADAAAQDYGTAESAAIGKKEILHASELLQKYKSAKANLEKKIVRNENFWKLRQWECYRSTGNKDDLKPASAYLWNAIVQKRADFIDGYPAPNVLPRMQDDEEEARKLSAVLPIVLAQSNFKRVYRDVVTYKLKQGTGVYGVFWDPAKNNGLGDIAIRKVDLLTLFWEPGVTDIQDSANVFVVGLYDNDVLMRTYPQLKAKNLSSGVINVRHYAYDDNIDISGKTAVVDWYYKKRAGNRTVLHYCKFVGDTVLYATENDTERPTAVNIDGETGETYNVPSGESMAEKGLYAHGKYPFVVDPLFAIEGTIAGYGYTDIGKDTQEQIDLINQAIVKNTMCGARPRYFVYSGGAVNEAEFADLSKDFVHVDGQLGADSIRSVDYKPLQGNYMSFLEMKIEELKEVTGNRDVNNGGSSGATAASAIAAMQEAGSKQSRDAISGTYDAFHDIVMLCIELMREKYDTARYFRILGEDGTAQYMMYDNSGLRPQPQGEVGGVDMGMRLPEFDIEVTAERDSPYNKMERNELAVQLYQLGVFSPQNTDQSLMLLETMDFDGKEDIIQRVSQSGTMYDMLLQYQQLALSLAAKYEPQTADMIAQTMGAGAATPQPIPTAQGVFGSGSGNGSGETRMNNARDAAQERTQPR